jgi:hypothetical protein
MRARSGDALDLVKTPEPFANLVPTGPGAIQSEEDSNWARAILTARGTRS